jgi:hypothetical protein
MPKSINNTATMFTARARFRIVGSIDFGVPFIACNATVPAADQVEPPWLTYFFEKLLNVAAFSKS